ncbi:hypothetical protein [Nocardia xishanensis]
MGSAGVGSAGIGSAGLGSAAVGSAALGSAAVGSASPLLLLLIPLPTPSAPAIPSAPLIIPPAPDVPAPRLAPVPVAAPPAPEAVLEQSPPPAPVLPQAPVNPNHNVRPTSADDGLPAPNVLSVVGGLIALALAGTGSCAVSFQSASAAQARVDAARAQFFGPRS